MKRTKANPIVKVIFILFSIYIVFMIFDQQSLIEEKQSEYDSLLAKIQAEEQQSVELALEKELLSSDESIEKIAREKLGLVKPGERVFVDMNRQ